MAREVRKVIHSPPWQIRINPGGQAATIGSCRAMMPSLPMSVETSTEVISSPSMKTPEGNGAIYDTPNMDSIGENGLNFENFYSGYSVCSPARFAALTGRYPYRGYADNVIYPTQSTFSPFAQTRVYNSFEMGNNVDGMMGDEITIAEVFQQAGYATGAFGKWHLGVIIYKINLFCTCRRIYYIRT